MKVQWYSNACVRISSSSGSSILCDPWVNDGAFLGSWFHWPPKHEDLASELIEQSCQGIYISHLHPDHYDPKFLNVFSKARPEVPIFIAQYAHPWLKRSITAVIDSRAKLIELPTLKDVEVAPGLQLKIFAADTCNPRVCGISVPCNTSSFLRGIDSIGVFSADGITVVNANDAMGIDLIPRITENIGRADLLMGHYGGASPFPQCFPEIKDKRSEIQRVVETCCNSLIEAADALDVQFVMPFAGQYMLGGHLVDLNDDRASIPLDEAVRYLQSMTNREVISMTPGGFVDFGSGFKSPDYTEPTLSTKTEYLRNLSKRKFPYQSKRMGEWSTAELDLLKSVDRILEKSKHAFIPTKTSFVIGDGNHFVTINLDPRNKETSASLGLSPRFDNVTVITMPRDLLRLLSIRKEGYKGFTTLHWNQADVGSHFVWKRTGNYDPISHQLLNFYGT